MVWRFLSCKDSPQPFLFYAPPQFACHPITSRAKSIHDIKNQPTLRKRMLSTPSTQREQRCHHEGEIHTKLLDYNKWSMKTKRTHGIEPRCKNPVFNRSLIYTRD
ncbi:MAG: hypothetical protein ACTSUE_08500 [Promethearchaeota archaeon]